MIRTGSNAADSGTETLEISNRRHEAPDTLRGAQCAQRADLREVDAVGVGRRCDRRTTVRGLSFERLCHSLKVVVGRYEVNPPRSGTRGTGTRTGRSHRPKASRVFG